jgi:hypothetical protein
MTRALIDFGVVFAFALVTPSYPQEAKDSRPQADSAGVLAAKLRRAAKNAENAELSKLFTLISDPQRRAAIGLSGRQVELGGRLEKLTGETIKLWLLQGLDSNPAPAPGVLAARLSDGGERLRGRIIAHAEGIMLEGVLTPKQRQECTKWIGPRPQRPPVGRFGSAPVPRPQEDISTDELLAAVQYYADQNLRAGEVFGALLGSAMYKALFPNGTEGEKGSRLELARSYMPKVALSKSQTDLITTLERVAIDSYRLRMTDGLEALPKPPRDVLFARVLGHVRLRDGIFGHAEVIALEGVLTADQADLCLASVWKEMGVTALLDPALANRLRLTRAQHEELLFLLAGKGKISDEQTTAMEPFVGFAASRPDLQQLCEQIADDARKNMGEIDGMIWDVLTPTQARALSRILNRTQPPGRQQPKPVKKLRDAP